MLETLTGEVATLRLAAGLQEIEVARASEEHAVSTRGSPEELWDRLEQLIAAEARTGATLGTFADTFRGLHDIMHRYSQVQPLLERLLNAQERTNRLLELALQAGFDDDEHLRRT
jgi:AraC-like DNA-binding protein